MKATNQVHEEQAGGSQRECEPPLLEALLQSQMYRDYEAAFSEMTGLPVTLQGAESWQLPLRRKKKENPFCAMMAERNETCAACLRAQGRLGEQARNGPATVTCELGLCDMAVPVRLGEKVIGYLKTGQVLKRKPNENGFEQVTERLKEWEVKFDTKRLKEAYFTTRVISRIEQDAVLKMLGIFAQHLALVGNQEILRRNKTEAPMIQKAKEYIEKNLTEELSLGQVAKAAGASTFYFCKMFHKTSGLCFTEYVSRARVERAKLLLADASVRVSDAAFQSGFQSLTHFNRVFRKITGQSPTVYREGLRKSAIGE